MQAAPTSFVSKEVGKKGNKKRGLRIAMRRSPPLFEITPARRAYRSGGAVFVSAPAVVFSLQSFPGEHYRFKNFLAGEFSRWAQRLYVDWEPALPVVSKAFYKGWRFDRQCLPIRFLY